ncbi:hypothetical protein BH23BAC2_BH23BAC2_11430 [soil metagenome]
MAFDSLKRLPHIWAKALSFGGKSSKPPAEAGGN